MASTISIGETPADLPLEVRLLLRELTQIRSAAAYTDLCVSAASRALAQAGEQRASLAAQEREAMERLRAIDPARAAAASTGSPTPPEFLRSVGQMYPFDDLQAAARRVVRQAREMAPTTLPPVTAPEAAS